MAKRGDLKAKAKVGESESGKPDYSWCERIFESLDYSDNVPADSIFALTDETPEWVQRVSKELYQQSMPSFQISKAKEKSPRLLGVLLGQMCANLYRLGEMLQTPTEEQAKGAESMLLALQSNQSVPGVNSLLSLFAAIGEMTEPFEDSVSKFEQTLHAAFKEALDQADYGQAVAFFQGFAKGIAKPGIVKGRLAKNTTTTPIYSRMLVHWREIEQLPNHPALRRFLIAQGLAESVLGDVKRLEKICERVGLHLAKRGRPSKAK